MQEFIQGLCQGCFNGNEFRSHESGRGETGMKDHVLSGVVKAGEDGVVVSGPVYPEYPVSGWSSSNITKFSGRSLSHHLFAQFRYPLY